MWNFLNNSREEGKQCCVGPRGRALHSCAVREGDPRGTEPSAVRGPRESERNAAGRSRGQTGSAQAPNLRGDTGGKNALFPANAPGSASCLPSAERMLELGGRPPKRGWCKAQSLGSPQTVLAEET